MEDNTCQFIINFDTYAYEWIFHPKMAAEFRNHAQPNFIPGGETSDYVTSVEEMMHKQHKVCVINCQGITLDF